MKYLLALLALFCGFTPAFAQDPPNVLIVLVDDLGYSDLSCYGGEIHTPHLDQLAENGLRFERGYNSARCCPSRASLMTGLFPHETGVGWFAYNPPRVNAPRAYRGNLQPENITIPELLKTRGYTTWMVGKWHLSVPGPIDRGFDQYYGYANMASWAEDQWDPSKNVRLPEGTEREIVPAEGEYYATDVFNAYTLEFIKQAQAKDKPWLLYLAHSSPHFPIQAPKESIDKHVETYRAGWDVLRAARLERMKAMGIMPEAMELPPLSQVPIDNERVTNGFSDGQENPAWDSLDPDRQEDLARRMATYAAMVEHVDDGIGEIVAHLEATGQLDNTIIMFTSDNGACYEWGPFGFDRGTRRGVNILHAGEVLATMGGPGTDSSYGSAWANFCNTPFNMYKHFCHEGGIASPMIVHWPAGIENPGRWVADPMHVMDVLPTVAEAAGAEYPEERDGHQVMPVSGVSLMPTFRGESLEPRTLPFEHQNARGLRKGDWKIVWGKRQPDPVKWELYNLAVDPAEQNDLAEALPEKLSELAAEWYAWADEMGIQYNDEAP